MLAGALSLSLATTPAPGPQARCVVTDPRLAELSGLVVDGTALWAVTDGGRRAQVHRLDPVTCAVIDTRTADIDPDDPEDLARGPDGSLWVGDIGDNDRERKTVAVVVLPSRGGFLLHRLTYPDGPHDAEALLVDAAGRPVIVTKEVGRPAGVYRTAARPDGSGSTPLERVGELTLPASDTAGGPVGGLGARLVTGAAASADGRVIALRSYTDAWLYPAPDGDVAVALARAPVQVPLPDEPQGEAIAFESDGTLLSGSETRGGTPGELRAVPGAGRRAEAPPPGVGPDVAARPDPAAEPGPVGEVPEWWPAALGGAVAVALLVGLAGATALRGRRRR